MVEVSLEMTLWFLMSLTIGMVIFMFLLNVDYDDFYSSINSFFNEEDNDSPLNGLSINDSIHSSLNLWKECGFGEIALNKTIYINETGILNNSIYFDNIKNWDLCSMISSQINNCGDSEELGNFEVQTPKIIKFSCDPVTSKLYIN